MRRDVDGLNRQIQDLQLSRQHLQIEMVLACPDNPIMNLCLVICLSQRLMFRNLCFESLWSLWGHSYSCKYKCDLWDVFMTIIMTTLRLPLVLTHLLCRGTPWKNSKKPKPRQTQLKPENTRRRPATRSVAAWADQLGSGVCPMSSPILWHDAASQYLSIAFANLNLILDCCFNEAESTACASCVHIALFCLLSASTGGEQCLEEKNPRPRICWPKIACWYGTPATMCYAYSHLSSCLCLTRVIM